MGIESEGAVGKGRLGLGNLWVVTTYFAEGFPYSLVRQISTVFFKDAGASLQAIGLTSLYGLPWVLKLLWAPLVDAYSSKRRWLVAFELLLAAAALLMVVAPGFPDPVMAASVVFLIIALCSATHDIAVDGFYLEALNRTEQAEYVGFQAMSYRLALIVGGGAIVALSGRTSWSLAFAVSAGILAALCLFHYLFLPEGEPPRRSLGDLVARFFKPGVLLVAVAVAEAAPVVGLLVLLGWEVARGVPALARSQDRLAGISAPVWISCGFAVLAVGLLLSLPLLKRRLEGSDSFYARAFVDYFDQRRIGVILAFLLLYRTGESFLSNMAYPFLKDVGVTRDLYGLIYGTCGIMASLVGGVTGGYLISKLGLKRVIWPFVFGQNALNLLYAALAWHYRGIIGRPELGEANLALVCAVVVAEALGSGLGTAVFMVFIMRTCKPAFKAAHFAFATGLMNISSTLAGVFSGFLATALGFPLYFGFTFLATIPGMALIFFLPYLDGSRAEDAPPSTR